MLKQKINEKLINYFSPSFIEVRDFSEAHRGHAGNIIANDTGEGNSHIAVTIVSEVFVDKTMLQRHRLVYEVLADEIKMIHALQLRTLTAVENIAG